MNDFVWLLKQTAIIRSNDLHYSFKHSGLKFKCCTEFKHNIFMIWECSQKYNYHICVKPQKTITKNIETLPLTENFIFD